MTAFAAHQLQQAVFALLAADTGLKARVTGVYDEPLFGARPPYVAFGETQLRDTGVKGRDGVTVSFDVIVWSAEPSQMEAKELMAQVDALLSGASPDVPGHELVDIKLGSASVITQFSEAGSLYRGRLNYSARLFEAA
ncbi:MULTISPECIES: DUF3168 domain-containing protein [Kordiimonas]|jgi:hypothetical protein|uniref:DUF3168 domain-containing protein n=1 Tax=Kordiimonas TaxID=288021 RepID=UPI00257F58C5|nr:DUF3168 domain-containing protein [Kordiimonas sp. UBA4487]